MVLEDGKEVALCTQESCSFKANKVPNKTGGRSYFHTGNLTGHLKRKHTPQFECLQSKRITNATAIPKKTLVEIELSKEEMERAAVEVITVNGLPLSVFEKS